MEHYVDALKQFSNTSGRATRTQFWMFTLINIIVATVLAVVDGMVFGGPILGGLYTLAMLVPSITLWIRRLHDIGKSGFYLLIVLVPLLGGLVMLVFSCTGSDGANDYGDPVAL
jgi:uncharacterized membrane protein YhaH (DUF805 family)